MLDDRTGSTRQVPPFIGRYVWTPADNRFGWSSLLGVPAGSAHVPPNSVPARVENLQGLAPAFIGVGSIDLFSNEDMTYAHRLMYSGVPAELLVVPGGYHGFDIFNPEASLSRLFARAWHEALQRAFSQIPAPRPA
jgi:acetyl esterase/lipase